MILKLIGSVYSICLRGIDHFGRWIEINAYQESNAISGHVFDRRDLELCRQEKSYKRDKESMQC